MTALESELAVLREVVAERDRLLQDVRALRDEVLPLRLMKYLIRKLIIILFGFQENWAERRMPLPLRSLVKDV